MKIVRLFRNSYERKFWSILNRSPNKKYERIIKGLEDECKTAYKDGMEVRMYDFDSMIGALEQDEILEISDFNRAFRYIVK